MKSNIYKILSDEAIKTIEEKLNWVTKEIALFTVPKEKFNRLSQKYKEQVEENQILSTKLKELLLVQQEAQQKRKQEEAFLEQQKKDLAMAINHVKAKELFKDANIDSDKVNNLLSIIISEDEQQTLDLVHCFIEVILDKQLETTENN